MKKLVIAILICLVVGILALCQLSSGIETAQTRRVVTQYGDILRESDEVKAALRNSGVEHYAIYTGRRLSHHYIEIAVDRPIQNGRHLEELCVNYLKANVESYQRTSVSVIVDANKANIEHSRPLTSETPTQR